MTQEHLSFYPLQDQIQTHKLELQSKMQPHAGESGCSCNSAGSHQEEEEESIASRDGEAECQDVQEDSEDMVEEGEAEETGQGGEISMSLASTIPSQIIAEAVMDTPLVVLLHRDSQSSTAINDIWVFVSLIDASSDVSARETDDVLKGQRADNAHPVLGYTTTRDDAFAYASFPNLLISRSGRYRLCVTAIDMSKDQSYVLPAITSEAFEVVDPTPTVPHDINTDGLRHLTLADLRAR